MSENLNNLFQQFSVKETYETLTWTGSFLEYLKMVQENPLIARNAYQRLYDMICSYGYEDIQKFKKSIRKWKFFDNSDKDGKEAIFGIEEELDKLVKLIGAGAKGYGVEKRILLLHGPVGSSKSTIANLLKRGLEKYSKTDEGALYTFQWLNPDTQEWEDSPMREEPLKLIPTEIKNQFVEKIFEGKDLKYPITTHEEDLDPASQKFFKHYMLEYKGDWAAMLQNCVRIKRLIISEKDRTGIGTYAPKDKKSQDATELTGDINYRKIALYGSDSDPRCFNFDGEFNVSNRGIIEFIEVLKLDVAFLYDLLTATQEKKIKPRKFAQMSIDEVIIGHTNNPEFKKLQNDKLMEAFKDRTIKIDVGYNLELQNEIKIYERDFSSAKKHIAPHTITIAAMWAVLTRLKEPKKADISLLKKLKLYDGLSQPGFNADSVLELKEDGREENEGMEGISPRFIQDKISNALADDKNPYINSFIILNELREGLSNHPLVNDKNQIEHYLSLLDVVEEEHRDIILKEIQKAICSDEDAISRLCANYIANVKAYCQKEKIKNKYTNQEEEPDETLMRQIEEKIDIAESRKEDFRKELLNYIGSLALDNKKFNYWDNERLQRALELKLFEDSRHQLNLSSYLSDVVDVDTQERINIIKDRLVKNYGYTNESAQDVINYAASVIHSSGDPT